MNPALGALLAVVATLVLAPLLTWGVSKMYGAQSARPGDYDDEDPRL